MDEHSFIPEWALRPPPLFQPASEPASEPAGQLAGNGTELVMLDFMLQVRERLPRCDVYFKMVDIGMATFKIEVLAFVSVGGDLFSSALRTPNISVAATQQKVDEEVDTMVLGLAKTLGVQIFTGRRAPIPEVSFSLFTEPA